MNNNLTCRILRGETEVFSSEQNGIAPLISIIDGGLDVTGCTAYDKIVGKAAALLYVLMGVKCVHAGILSEAGESVLKANGIEVTGDTVVEKIINRTGDGICPMEMTVADINDPSLALTALKEKIRFLKEQANKKINKQ